MLPYTHVTFRRFFIILFFLVGYKSLVLYEIKIIKILYYNIVI